MDLKRLEQELVKRLNKFGSRDGSEGQALEDGSDWSSAEWLQAVTAELGEYANERRAFDLGRLKKAEFKERAGKELADVLMFLVMLAWAQGIDIVSATEAKFNEVNARLGLEEIQWQ